MPAPSVTYSFTNGTAADATAVNTNFTDLVNALSDGLKDITVSSVTTATLTVSGIASFNGAVNLGNATGDDITVTGYIASDLLPKTAGTASLGSSTQTWEDIYLDEGATNGGTIYFNAGTSSYIQSSADGATLTIGGFTGVSLLGATITNKLHIGSATAITTNTANIVDEASGSTLGLYRFGGSPSLRSYMANGSQGAPTKTTTGNNLGSFIGYGLHTDGAGNYGIGGWIRMQATENWSSTAYGTKIEFLTAANGSTSAAVALTLGQDKSATFTGLLDISGASAGQIKFPATQNASSDANTLDDYEEGTWTPSLGGTATYIARTGTYTKIGRVVTVQFDFTVNAIGTGTTSEFSGLPYISAPIDAQGGGLAYWETTNGTYFYITVRVDSSQSKVLIGGVTAATATLTATINCIQSGTRLIGSITYIAAT